MRFAPIADETHHQFLFGMRALALGNSLQQITEIGEFHDFRRVRCIIVRRRRPAAHLEETRVFHAHAYLLRIAANTWLNSICKTSTQIETNNADKRKRETRLNR